MEDITWRLAFCSTVLVALLTIFTIWRRGKIYKMLYIIPGPLSLPILGNVQVFRDRKNRMKRMLNDARKYRKEGIYTMWFGPKPCVVLCSAETIEPILSSQKHLDKGDFYWLFHDWLKLGLLTSSREKWLQRRRLLTPAFHFRILEDFIPVFNEQSEIFVKKLEKYAAGNEPFDIFPDLTLLTLEIICSSAMGINMNFQIDNTSEYATAILQMTHTIYWRMLRPWYYLSFLYKMTENGKQYYKYLNIVHSFTRQVISDRKQQLKNETKEPKTDEINDENIYCRRKRLAFLDLLIEYSDDGKVLSDADIQEEVDTFMFEGHDTTATGIFWNIYFLGLHPEIQKKVQEEVDNVFENSNGALTSESIRELKYLECICKESLRLYPSVPQASRKFDEDVPIGNYVIPAGVDVTIQFLSLHRDERYFPDPEKFDPDRFLPENIQGRHPYAYAPFSAGPRNCIGQKFALMEEKVVLAYVLKNFNITTIKKTDAFYFGIPELVFRPNGDVQIKLEKRV